MAQEHKDQPEQPQPDKTAKGKQRLSPRSGKSPPRNITTTWLILRNIPNVVFFLILLWLYFMACSGAISGILAFLPPWGWFLPCAMTLAWGIWQRWWEWCGWSALNAFLVFFGLMGPVWNRQPPAPARLPGVLNDLVIMSNNYGQRNHTSIDPFIHTHEPDLILLQEAGNREPKYRQRLPDYHVRGKGEFLIMCKFPVEKIEPILFNPEDGRLLGVRYLIHYGTTPVAIYNIHLPTPRRILAPLRSSRLGGLLPSRQALSLSAWRRVNQFWANQYAIAQALVKQLEQEKYPWIMAGDFNTPAFGRIYRLLRNYGQDTFRQRGRGFGYSFPGSSERFYSLGVPWLRLDYIWTSSHWYAVRFYTETKRRSQHRSVLARLRLLTKKRSQ